MSAPLVAAPGQHKGPITRGPTGWVVCEHCEVPIVERDGRVRMARYGVPKRRLRAHLRDLHGIRRR